MSTIQTMSKRKHNIPAIVKAYEMEAKRAERNIKLLRGDPICLWWADYAAKCYQYAHNASTQPSTVDVLISAN